MLLRLRPGSSNAAARCSTKAFHGDGELVFPADRVASKPVRAPMCQQYIDRW